MTRPCWRCGGVSTTEELCPSGRRRAVSACAPYCECWSSCGEVYGPIQESGGVQIFMPYERTDSCSTSARGEPRKDIPWMRWLGRLWQRSRYPKREDAVRSFGSYYKSRKQAHDHEVALKEARLRRMEKEALEETKRAARRKRARERAQQRRMAVRKRFDILERDGFRCVYCGASPSDNSELHVDHIYPLSRGGVHDDANLATACIDCNLGKGARVLKETPNATT